MGQHYLSNTEDGPVGFLKGLWQSTRWCQWVEPSDGSKDLGKDIYFYRNRNGLGVKPSKVEKKVE